MVLEEVRSLKSAGFILWGIWKFVKHFIYWLLVYTESQRSKNKNKDIKSHSKRTWTNDRGIKAIETLGLTEEGQRDHFGATYWE